MLDIKQKVGEEYIFFQQMLLGTSKQNIFNKSEEIVFKQKIKEEIQRMDFSEKEILELMCVDNLLEYIYLVCSDMRWSADQTDKAIKEILRRIRTKKN